MTESKTKTRLQDEFNALPLEEKFANLFRMEATTLGEALKFVADSSMKAVQKAGEAIHDLSAKMEAEVKKATAECKTNGKGATAEPKKATGSTKRTPPRSKKKPS
ncbi:MAG: hypothetical protein KBD94_10350 [Pyrinomonadaceae bacterium]|nr:hypothetical protein [Pyrinomonadaceae bacterium]